ncbi:MAG: glycosyltransferase family 4 protein [Chloroflexi bacterium]|nr:glycosyltransferase family 4 protein [Chloroflexota bacterium]
MANGVNEVIVVGAYPPVVGGIASALDRLVRSLEANEVRVRVFNTQKGDSSRGPLERIGRLLLFVRIAVGVGLHHEKLVHCHSGGWWGLVGATFPLALARLTGKKVVLTLHAGDLLAVFSAPRSIRGKLARRIVALANAITTVTPELRDALSILGLATKREVIFISNAFPARPGVEYSKERVSTGLLDFERRHKPVVVGVGSMQPVYAIDVLLRAHALLKERFPQVGTIVVAFKAVDPVYWNEVKALVENLGISESVYFAESGSSVRSILNMSDVFVRANHTDGDSMAIREALECRTPVVASRVGYRPSAVRTFEPGNARDLAQQVSVAFTDLDNCDTSSGSQREEDVGAENMRVILQLYKRLQENYHFGKHISGD